MLLGYICDHIHNMSFSLKAELPIASWPPHIVFALSPASSNTEAFSVITSYNFTRGKEGTREMEQLKHFSHDRHPLILVQVKQNEANKSNCYGCQEPILTEPTYSCRKCKIFLHRRCAELPMEIMHPLHAEHPLKLVMESGNMCHVCKSNYESFIYKCKPCNFNIHNLCVATERRLEHPCHEHPLTMVQRPATFQCNACGNDKKTSLSYMCINCTYWIHRSCALLPNIYQREDHPHPLSLAYSFPIQYKKYNIPCGVCLEYVFFHGNWVYYCGPCRYFVHLDCITRAIEYEYNLFAAMEPSVTLPADNFIRAIRDVVEKEHHNQIQRRSSKNVPSHEHPLISFDLQEDINSMNKEITCNSCTEPIISSGYNCVHCNYSLHLTCAQLPNVLKDSSHCRHRLELFFQRHTWEIKTCDLCGLDCNGSLYRCRSCDSHLDIKCALLPGLISHKAHIHPLLQSLTHPRNKDIHCSGCGDYATMIYLCYNNCKFSLDCFCAQLPQRVKHRWDKHPLILSFPPFPDQPDEFYCEICEEEIHPMHWQYRCRECDQSFHPKCIPRFGESKNIKFGDTINVSGHQHPITSVREGEYLSSCSSCHRSLYGKRAFKCATCEYHVCYDCVSKIAV